ncbi:hypothetical protein WI23_24215 [Burkholderia oklahomensis C6786]|nr:hypothetical protein WI23_24215 [Burkholderia oklahomensis C6786]KUY50482.1 hypothetical protein WI23_27035 [Burkholderia oklahomensis C6786]
MSLKVAGVATVFASLAGIALGWLFARRRFPTSRTRPCGGSRSACRRWRRSTRVRRWPRSRSRDAAACGAQQSHGRRRAAPHRACLAESRTASSHANAAAIGDRRSRACGALRAACPSFESRPQ